MARDSRWGDCFGRRPARRKWKDCPSEGQLAGRPAGSFQDTRVTAHPASSAHEQAPLAQPASAVSRTRESELRPGDEGGHGFAARSAPPRPREHSPLGPVARAAPCPVRRNAPSGAAAASRAAAGVLRTLSASRLRPAVPPRWKPAACTFSPASSMRIASSRSPRTKSPRSSSTLSAPNASCAMGPPFCVQPRRQEAEGACHSPAGDRRWRPSPRCNAAQAEQSAAEVWHFFVGSAAKPTASADDQQHNARPACHEN